MGLSQGNVAPQVAPQARGNILQPSQLAPQQQPQAPAQQSQQQPQGPQLSDTGSFLGNVGNSIGNFAGAIGNAVAHPIDTVTNIGKGLIGGGENLAAYATTGKSAAENGKGDQFTAVADNIGNYIKTRYGSLSAAKQTFYNDPIGALADFSMVAGGAGEAIGAVGDASKVGTLSDIGGAVSKAGEVSNPLSLAGKAVSPIVKPIANFAGEQVSNILGMTTGAGGSSIKGVFNAAKEGSPEAMQAARGGITDSQILDTAQTALDNLKQAKNTTYQQQLQAVKGVTGEMDFQPVVDTFRKQLADNGITVKAGELNFDNARGFQSVGEQSVLQTTYDKLERWGDTPKNNTLFGGDTLKQQLGDFYEQAGPKSGAVIAQTKTVLSDMLKQNPEYKNLVEPYETTSNLISEMKTLISKNPETALKKLTKAVSQDNGYRQSLIDQLSKTTPNGENLKAQIAGLNMKSVTNPGKLTTMMETGTVLLHPTLLPAFIASSPRVVAEFMNALGYSSSKIDAGLQLLKAYKVANPQTLNTAGRVNKATSSAPAPGKPNSKGQILIRAPQKAPPQ